MTYNRYLLTTRVVAALLAISLGAAACGSSAEVTSAPGDSPAVASAPDEQAPATPVPEAASGETIDVGGGFLTLTLPSGWEVVGSPLAVIDPTVDNFDDTYTFALDNLQNLVAVGNGNLTVFLANEPRLRRLVSQCAGRVVGPWRG